VSDGGSSSELRRTGWRDRYAVAVGLAALATLMHAVLHRPMGPHFDPLFLVVVGLSAWYGGFGSGLATLALAGVGAVLWRLQFSGPEAGLRQSEVLGASVYAVSGLVMSWIIDRLRTALHRAERAASRTARLHALNLSLAPALGPAEVAAVIIRHAMEALSAVAGAIVLPGPSGEPTPAIRSAGHPGDPDAPDGPLAEVLHSRRPVFVETAAEWRARYPSAGAGERGSLVALPFATDGGTGGAMELEFAHDRRFAPDDRNFIVTLVGQGAQALERARLYEAERSARRHAEHAREQVAFLAEVSAVLASSIEYRATLTAAAQLAVPRLADWCAVDVLGPEGRLRRVAIAHTDPAKVDAVWAMSHRYPETSEDPVPQVIRSAVPQLVPDIPDDLLRRFARDPEHLAGLRAFGLRSLMIVPLVARGRTLGAITFVMAESGRRYGPNDLVLAEELARRAGLAVDNARLYQETEEALKEKDRSLELLDTVFTGAPVGLAFLDRALRFVRVNEALARMNGVAREAHLGRTLEEVLGAAGTLVAGYFAEVLRTGRPVLEREIVAPAPEPGAAGRIYLASYYPVGLREGAPDWVGCIVLDITERRRAAELLAQGQRLEAIAKVAGGVAHEVNNMMTVITGFSGFLLEALDPGDQRVEDVIEIRRAADRAAGITRQLLAYSRQQLLQPVPLELNSLIRRLVPVLDRLLGSEVRVELSLDPDLVVVRADESQLEQVLLNLALNARDAMGGTGTLAVTTENVSLSERGDARYRGPRIVPGRYARLTVTDTGHGMDAATRARVFEPFFTTKSAGQGSGLGLATVYGIVKQSDGYVWVESEVARGTTFTIDLPELAGAAPADAPLVPPPAAPGGHETILVVDDEPAVRRMVVRCLGGLGYTVLEAEHGAEALDMLDLHSGSVALVLTDVVMPVLNGRELGERLLAARPDLPVLFMSGYTDDEVVRRGLLRPDAPFLQKPFEPANLSRLVREMLDA
jgi:two-component system, cell cycle sensor histidine kinase and response regulator CckA